jgi:ATP-dependent Lhr-like helicase
LATLRAEIKATDRATFQAFLQRWQHVDPRDRLTGEAGVAAVVEQLTGLARPALGWERDYLPARIERYDGAWLSRLASTGGVVWAAAPRRDKAPGPGVALATVRFFERGTGALWLPRDEAPAISETASIIRTALAEHGASFLGDLQTATDVGPLAARDALRELVTAGVVTNDTIEALREVVRTRALPLKRSDDPDPTRWLPAGFTPSAGRVVQRRINVTRLPRWRRPDRPGSTSAAGWVGRWSLLTPPGSDGRPSIEEEQASEIARHWLARYGVVARDWWRRERPPIGWRAIYHELKRLEYRGEVRRGYFVEGLAGAQFALPDAVEHLRAMRDDPDAPFVAFAASDPANVHSLPRSPLEPAGERDALAHPRGSGAVLVTRRGVVLLAAEGRGRRVRFAPGIDDETLLGALTALSAHLTRGDSGERHRRVRTLETIDGAPAGTGPRLAVFRRAGFRLAGMTLDYPERQR